MSKRTPDDGSEREQARLEQQLDQRLAEVRDEYLSFNAAERSHFRDWITKLVELEEPDVPDVIANVKVRVEFLVPDGDGFKRVLASVRSVKRAMPFWDRGEDYVPSPRDR